METLKVDFTQMNNHDLKNIAQKYLHSGWSVLPARKSEKRPVISWKQYQTRRPTPQEIDAWFSNSPDAICLVTGKISNNREIIDFDNHGELFEAWKDKIPAELFEQLVIESTPSGGRHVIYGCECEVSGNLKLAQRAIDVTTRSDASQKISVITLIETRGEGGLFLCAPTEGYKLIQGDLENIPTLTSEQRDTLLMAAWQLSEYDQPVRQPEPIVRSDGDLQRPGDDYNSRGDIHALLQAHDWQYLYSKGENEVWRRPGKTSGSGSATYSAEKNIFYVFSSNAAPFESCKGYSPFAVYTMLEHNGDYSAAGGALRSQGYGESLPQDNVDLSFLDQDEDIEPSPEAENPGAVPDSLLRIPGFVGEIIDFCMAGAPYPSLGMAFCGALAMQAHLCGQKVREASDLRTNIYLLALASSASGKNYPRQINSYLSVASNMPETIRNNFVSGEGIEDRLQAQPCSLYQSDEIDGILQSINKSRDSRYESIITTLLTMYSSSNMMYPMRTKAGKQESNVIHQPHLTLFGTATPVNYYEALSQKMLTNGFFSRMIIVDTGKRAMGQDQVPVDKLPASIIETAKWWGRFQPVQNGCNLIGLIPKPVTVQYDSQAKQLIDEFRYYSDKEYSAAEGRDDEPAMTVWGRANENARKLALLYACSENHRKPVIKKAAVEWAVAFVDHQIRRNLFMVSQYVSSDDFDALCKRAVRILREFHLKNGKDSLYTPCFFRRKLSLHPSIFKDVTYELQERKLIALETQPTKTKPKHGYRLLQG